MNQAKNLIMKNKIKNNSSLNIDLIVPLTKTISIGQQQIRLF